MVRFFPTLVFCITLLTMCVTQSVYAQSSAERQVLSVTPPLFQLSILPGDIWQSSVKVVNGNPYSLTVYAEVVNFKPVGEAGQGVFSSIEESGGNNATLAEWVHLPIGPYTIEPEQTKDVQFFIESPKNAPPGGHYAAILISTEPPKEVEKMAVRTSQSITSLLFMRVEGDVREDATIREFRAIDSFLSTPDVTFSLRFENKGNVHVQPRGNIVITNMWGTERGTIPINYQTRFGNVLPESIRDFSLAWKSEFKITDIGRYKAIATLGYGENEIRSSSAITYFWVIPVKWTLITVCIIAMFITFVVLMVKAYIRRVLALAGVSVPQTPFNDSDVEKIKTKETAMKHTYSRVSAPLRDGVIDLRTRLHTSEKSESTFMTMMNFVIHYKWFFLSVAVLIALFVTVTLYVGSVTNTERAYEVSVDDGTEPKVLNDDAVESLMAE